MTVKEIKEVIKDIDDDVELVVLTSSGDRYSDYVKIYYSDDGRIVAIPSLILEY